MKGMKLVLLSVLVSFPGLALAEGNSRYVGDNLAKQQGNFRYVGNNLARQVCRAVVNDDVTKLKLALHSYQQSLAHGYTFDMAGRQVSQDFTCNGMDVLEFSQQVGAVKVVGFINGATPSLDSQVAATGS